MTGRIYNQVDGMLLVDKPADWTSHDVVNFLRRRFNLRKTGHCGTLDPFATSLLILLLGKACKLQDRFMAEDKVYSGTIQFGVETDSQDCSGQVTRRSDSAGLDEAALQQAVAGFLGEQLQTPPMYSAIKQGGQPLYKLARKGLEVERKARRIHIHSFVVGQLRAESAQADFELKCSKGTYVRTVAAELGQKLGCGAHLLELRRLQSGDFKVKEAHQLESMKNWELADLCKYMLPLEQILAQG